MAKTMQQAFNKVIRKMRKQGVASYGSDGCAYTDEHGNHCGVGIYFTKSALKYITLHHLQNSLVSNLADHSILFDELSLQGEDWDSTFLFWQVMQGAHDNGASRTQDVWQEDCEAQWRSIADNRDLKMPPGKFQGVPA